MELIAKRLVEIVDGEIYRDVIEQLAAEGEVGKRKLAYLYSCKDKASGSWIRSFVAVKGGLQFISNADFSSILGARLQVNQQGFDGTALAKCPGCYNRFNHEQEGLVMGPSHALDCRGEGALSIGRHNKVRNLAAEKSKLL